MEQCPCGSMLLSSMCCQQYISGERDAPTAEALMRSRYTAFTQQNANYLFQTFASEWRKGKAVADLKQGLGELTWTGLEVTGIFEGGRQHQTGEVEFLAHYQIKGQSMTLHERSLFIREEGNWRYLKAKD
jgi:SEC-C motif domain protein